MALVQFKNGLKANLPAAGSQVAGVIYFTTDTNEIWCGGKMYAAGVDLTEVKRALAGYLDGEATVAGALEAAIQSLDVTEFALAEKDDSTNEITIHGISETDGEIAVGSDSANDVTFAAVAATGEAEDVAYDNTASELTSTNVQDAIDELAEASAGGVASKTIWGHDDSAGQSDYAKVYKIYQGENDYVKDREDGKENPELKLTINIPKDKVLEDATIVTITFSDNKLYDGVTDVTTLIKGSETPTAADAGKYLKMTMQNVTDPLYVNLQTFVDVYTVESGATEVQLALNDHEFSGQIVDIAATKITYIAADATEGIARESVGAALTRLDGADNVTGSVAKKVKDAVDALDAVADSTKTAIDGDTPRTKTNDDAVFALQAITEADGKLSAMTAVEVAQIGTGTGRSGSGTEQDPYVYDDTIVGAKKYTDDKVAEVGSAVEDLDLAEAPIAEVSSNVVTIHGISQTDGQVAIGSDSANDIVLEEVAYTGAAADVSIADAGGYTSETTVEAALQEIYGQLTWGSFNPVTP